MDPLTMILTALASGAAALAKGTLDEAGKNIYSSIVGKVRRKLNGNPQGQTALAEYEKDPETWEKPLRKSLAEIGAGNDQELLRMANSLFQQFNDIHIVNSNIENSTVVIQRGDHSVYIGQAQQVVLSNPNRPKKIREVILDLRIADDQYPTFFWFEEAETPNLFNDGTPQITREWWEPVGYSHEKLEQFLLNEINNLGASGWTLVEQDFQTLWQHEHSVQETLVSKLSNLIGMSIGRTWKHSLVYYRARFHVQNDLE